MRWWPLIVVWLVACAACDDEYPIEPTLCDEWCRATERAGCEEDYPEQCVSRCESGNEIRSYPQCQASWQSAVDCYLDSEDWDFTCHEFGEFSIPRDVCQAQRIAFAECVGGSAALCVEQCFRQAEACGGVARSCEEGCFWPSPGCETESHNYHTCALSKPVDCTDPESDTRALEDIPCLQEIGELLDCAGWPTPDAGVTD
jgi:hypothetical protein